MRRPSVLAVAGLAGAVAGAAALLRRREAPPRVDVIHDDGSVDTLEASTPQAQRMLRVAQDAVAAARGT